MSHYPDVNSEITLNLGCFVYTVLTSLCFYMMKLCIVYLQLPVTPLLKAVQCYTNRRHTREMPAACDALFLTSWGRQR